MYTDYAIGLYICFLLVYLFAYLFVYLSVCPAISNYRYNHQKVLMDYMELAVNDYHQVSFEIDFEGT